MAALQQNTMKYATFNAGHLQVCFLDYVRFLVGSMWGACTPESFAAKAGMLNQGMHKRDVTHHLHMLRRALTLLAQEKQSGVLAPPTRTTA